MTEYTCDSFRFFNLFPVYFGGKGTVEVFTLVQIAAYRIRLYPPSPASIPSSTQNAPGFAFFGSIRVRFLVFHTFGHAKFSGHFLFTLSHSVYRLKSLVIPLSRDVSFLT